MFLQRGYHDFEGLLIGKSFIDDLDNIDIYSIASKYEGKILLLHGDSDEVVSLRASEKYMDYYGIKANLAIINGADHQFSKKEWEQQVSDMSAEFFGRLLDSPQAQANTSK